MSRIMMIVDGSERLVIVTRTGSVTLETSSETSLAVRCLGDTRIKFGTNTDLAL